MQDPLRHKISDIDGQYGQANVSGTIYITSLQQRRKVEAIVDTFQTMRQGVEDDTPVCQAPQYVGCTSGTIAQGTKVYHPETKWDKNKGNHVYWLVMSCIRQMGLEPVAVINPLIRVWAEGQLQCSEILGTMIAGSLVEDRGYNVTQPSSNSK